MIEGHVTGVGAVIVKLRAMSARAQMNVRLTVRQLGLELERLVKTHYLNGFALHRRTGRLARDVNTKFISTPTSETARTGVRVVYGAAWEKGFHRRPSTTSRARSAREFFRRGTARSLRAIASAGGKYEPARPFLRPALQQLAPRIRERLRMAATGG